MITLNFYTLAEKTPKHNESIIYLDKKYSFDSYGFQPREINVEYSWELVESDGTHCGGSVGYDENDPTPPELSEEENSEKETKEKDKTDEEKYFPKIHPVLINCFNLTDKEKFFFFIEKIRLIFRNFFQNSQLT